MSGSVHDTTPTVTISHVEFLRDVKFVLHQHLPVSMGHLDEAIARGLGFRSHAALLAQLKQALPLQVCINDRAFRERLNSFDATASEGLFMRCIMDTVPKSNGEVRIGYSGEQERALGRVLVRLVRIPSDAELDASGGLEWETFSKSFRDRATSADPWVAEAINLGESVDIDGWRVPVGPSNTWLVVE